MTVRRIAFDLDKTLCTGYPYIRAVPNMEMIKIVNELYHDLNFIIIFTARGMSTDNIRLAKLKYLNITVSQLDRWGVKYHQLIMGKPDFDLIIDDKAFNARHVKKKEDIYNFIKLVQEE
jgi:phosphoglycolate phosphatase-like HAD superfamily hydrolase